MTNPFWDRITGAARPIPLPFPPGSFVKRLPDFYLPVFERDGMTFVHTLPVEWDKEEPEPLRYTHDGARFQLGKWLPIGVHLHCVVRVYLK